MGSILLLTFPLQDAGDLLDTTLVAKDGEVRCHAIIMLSQLALHLDQQEGHDYTIIVPDFCLQDLKEMLSYCYIGRYDSGNLSYHL